MKTKLLLAACVAIAIVGVVVFFLRRSSRDGGGKTATLSPPACLGDKSCAVDRATALKKASHDESSTLMFDAMALGAALAKDDCDAATEIAGGIERVPFDRKKKPELAKAVDAALLGRLGYCAVAAKKTPAPPPPDATITLSRGACEGTCPIYVVTVRADGEVTYDGDRFVATTGKAVRHIAPAKARELFDAFTRLGFERGPPAYSSGVMDYPGAKLTLTGGGTSHVLEDDAPCFGIQSINEGSCYLELRVDEIAETSVWVDGPRDH